MDGCSFKLKWERDKSNALLEGHLTECARCYTSRAPVSDSEWKRDVPIPKCAWISFGSPTQTQCKQNQHQIMIFCSIYFFPFLFSLSMFANELSSHFTRREKWTRHICPSSLYARAQICIINNEDVLRLLCQISFGWPLFAFISQFVVRIGALLSCVNRALYAFSFSSSRLLSSSHGPMRICLDFNWRWHPCGMLPACMRVFLRLLILLCQLIGYVFLFFTLFFSDEERAQAYRKCMEKEMMTE